MYYIHIISLLYGLSIDIKYVTFPWTDTIQAFDKFENLKLLSYFLNKDISFDISLICLKSSTHVDKGHLEGSMSHNYDLSPSFNSMQSRK